MTTSSQTDFVGEYSAAVGNFVRVQSGSRTGPDETAQAAFEILAFPRAKYACQRALHAKSRVRTESA